MLMVSIPDDGQDSTLAERVLPELICFIMAEAPSEERALLLSSEKPWNYFPMVNSDQTGDYGAQRM
jgi:hypothetical protein